MKVCAYKDSDGTKTIDIEFNQSDMKESVFVNMILDRFLDIPAVAYNLGGIPKDVEDRLSALFGSNTRNASAG